jgi:pimeloyl-ACP methyl ester carboxylesterase
MPETNTVTSPDGTCIAYERAGSGPALVLVDPAGGFRGFGPMPPVVPLLSEHFTVLSYDRRGRGESTDTPPYDVAREVEDLRAVIDATGGPAYVYGYSSGATLALHAAIAGLPIRGLALFEPPVKLPGDPPEEGALAAEVTELVAAGRRGDAYLHFLRSIGVPEEMIGGIRQHPAWPELEKLAHTLAYDPRITTTLPFERLAEVTVPTLVLHSEGSDERLDTWAKAIGTALPDASIRALKGEWHGVPPETLVPVITEFFRA